MDKMFCAGLALGMIGGALIVANCQKARQLVKKSQEEVVKKVDDVIDDGLKKFGSDDCMNGSCEQKSST